VKSLRDIVDTPRRVVAKASFPLRAAPTPNGVEPAAPKRNTGADFDTDWARSYPARLGRAALIEGVVSPAMSLIASPRREGLDRLDDLEGPAIFIANHHSHLDTALMLSTLPDPWRHHLVVGAAADYFFGSRVSGAISAFGIGAIPIERTKVGRRSADLARGLIDDGWSLLLFPEGGRSPDGWGQPFRGGAGFLAVRCGVPVVPVHIVGTDRLLPKGAKRLRAGSTTITFGSPLRSTDGENARGFAQRLEDAVAVLADEATTDWWSARQRSYRATTPTMTGPAANAWRRAWARGDRRGRTQRRQWPRL
jgi:1-acyl-sn-glycerol-3-phosphate acyltransferase